MKYIEKDEKLDEAVTYIKEGNLAIFPTETVYGIGANALDSNAVEKIFKIKGRKQDNPLIVHIASIDMLGELVKGVNKIEQKLIDRFWPGPLTIIFKKKDIVPSIVTCNLDTVGIRMPSLDVARKFISECGVPIAAPSANISGKPSGTIVDDILIEFMDEDIAIIDGGESEIGLESTVVKVVEDVIVILRPGFVTYEQLSEVAKTKISENVFKKVSQDADNAVIESPGMKYRHYAPNCKCVLVVGELDVIRKKVLCEITKVLEEKTDSKIVVLYKYVEPTIKLDNVQYICMGENDEEISKNIYHLLRKLDKISPDIAYIEGVEKKGLGIAIVNRLIRACEYNII